MAVALHALLVDHARSPGQAKPAGSTRANPLHELGATLLARRPRAKRDVEQPQPIGPRRHVITLVKGTTDERSQRTTALGGLIPQARVLSISQGDLGTMHSDVVLHHLERGSSSPIPYPC